MAFFEELGKKISKSGQEAAQKAKNLAETVRLNGLISEEEKRITNTYLKIGQQYYETLGDNTAEQFAGFIADINNAKATIQKHTDQVKQLRGVTVCEKCGGEVSSSSPFCSACGSAVTITVSAPAAASGNACTNCSTPLASDTVFCTNCGTKAEQPAVETAPVAAAGVCTSCNHETAEGAVFCLNCGSKLS